MLEGVVEQGEDMLVHPIHMFCERKFMTSLCNEADDTRNHPPSQSDTLEPILQAAHGLLMPSESDYPFTPFRWSGPGPLTPDALVAHLELPHDTPVVMRTLTQFFAPIVATREWHTDEDQAQVSRFLALHDALTTHLSDLVVFRVGEISIQAFIVGTDANGATVGLHTTQIET